LAAIALIGALGFLLDALAQRLHRHWVSAGTD
jgi:NitT/TauT family transport system permease protein